MAVKLKLKVPSSEAKTKENKDDEKSVTSTPKIKIKPPSSNGQGKESLVFSIGKKKVKVGKEKANKIKLSLKNKAPSDSMDLGTQPTKIVPKVRVKPTRIPGEGYDSEAPNLEDDPLLEQGIIIRFLNDSKLDFVQNAVDSGDLSGINIKWVAKDKAVVNIKGTFYSARLVDLPTITELYKTVDKKNVFKTLDVWQMLLILKEVIPTELSIDKDFELDHDNLYTHPLYNMTTKNELKPSKLVYRDGLTSPYEDVFRRFRPRKVNHRVLNDIDSRVNELIKLDNEAEETHFEIVDLSKDNSKFASLSATPSNANSPQVFNTAFDRDEDSMIVNDDVIESDLEEELAKALANDEEIEIEEGVELDDQNTAIEEDIDVAAEEEEEEEEEEEDDEEEDDDEDDDEEENKADKQHAKMLEEEIADLEKVVEVHRRGLASATHKMMKMKFQTSYNTLKNSLDAKKRELSKMINELSDKINTNLYTQPSSQRQEAEEEEEEDEDDEEEEEEEEEADENNNEELQGHEGQDDDIDDLF